MFDRAFAVFWDRREAHPGETELPPEEVIIALDVPGADEAAAEDDEVGVDAPVVTLRWSPKEILRRRDFALYTPAEFVEARRLMNDLRLVGAARPSRRRKRSRARSRRARPAPHRAAVDARRWRTGRARVSRAGRTQPPARVAARRQRFDGAVRPRLRSVPARGGDQSLARRGVRARNPPDARDARARPRAIPTLRYSRPRAGSRTGPAGPASARASSTSTTNGGSAAWRAARSSSSSPTAGTAGSPECSPSRWPGSRGSPTASCGSTR